MPVKTEPKMNLIDYLMIDPITEPLLPDDIWKKFELDFPEISGGIDDVFEETTVSVKSEQPYLDDLCEIRNHDCMWAGHCGSKEHPSDESHAHCLMRPPAVPVKVEVVCPPPPPQQSLLKPAVRAANAALPQTPPMSDDEECKRTSTSVLKLLHDAIEDCDLDEDSDLCDYFEDKEEVNVEDDLEEEEEEQERARSNIIKSYQFAAESDHSYHKGKAAATHVLGIETPSDSEEEIDVVSVVDKKQFTNNHHHHSAIINNHNHRVFSLPNNPSNRDRHQIQRRMATAISKKKMANNSIKTILPIRRKSGASFSPPDCSPAKKKAQGVKRTKQPKLYRVNTPYKRRNCGHSSDSEPEPSEKRSLHNNMERQRRIDLRNAFEDLRVLVPEVSKKERAAKVVILREAAQYCDFLTNTSDIYAKHMEDLKKQQEWLRLRVSQLRRNLAAKR